MSSYDFDVTLSDKPKLNPIETEHNEARIKRAMKSFKKGLRKGYLIQLTGLFYVCLQNKLNFEVSFSKNLANRGELKNIEKVVGSKKVLKISGKGIVCQEQQCFEQRERLKFHSLVREHCTI